MIGIDLVYIPEFQKQLSLGGDTFLRRAFSPNELGNRRPEHLAGIWAAKEAVVKAGQLTPGDWTTIQVCYTKEGRPSAQVDDQVFELSIAHHGDYAVAVALKMVH